MNLLMVSSDASLIYTFFIFSASSLSNWSTAKLLICVNFCSEEEYSIFLKELSRCWLAWLNLLYILARNAKMSILGN